MNDLRALFPGQELYLLRDRSAKGLLLDKQNASTTRQLLPTVICADQGMEVIDPPYNGCMKKRVWLRRLQREHGAVYGLLSTLLLFSAFLTRSLDLA